jgi:similar to stage IV sporulation protein
MMRLDHLLLGYRIFTVDSSDISRISNRLIKTGMSYRISTKGEIQVLNIGRSKLKGYLEGINYKESDLLGLPGFLIRRCANAGFIFAFILLAVIYIYSSLIVWDVRIEGNDLVKDSDILDELKACGLYSGAMWHNFDTSKIEAECLSSSEKIAWLSINRKGTVAYVKVKEKSANNLVPDPLPDTLLPANIVSLYDCVIEEINVEQGIALVKPGDVVKRGQILISGVIPGELGGGAVRAKGSVLGKVTEVVSCEIDRVGEVESLGREVVCLKAVNFFGFSINIYKKYGNLPQGCDIIEKTENVTLFGKYKLPICMTSVFFREKKMIEYSYSDEEMLGTASKKISELKTEVLGTGDVIFLKTEGGFITEDRYSMICRMVILKDVIKIDELTK